MGRTPSTAVLPWLPGFHMDIYDLALSFGGFETPLASLAQSPTCSMSLAGAGQHLHLASSAPVTESPWRETLHFWWL